MGEVFLADDTKLDRKVALKFLPASLWNESEARERLIREAKSASKLDHPNVVTIFGIEEHEGRPFISMAHVPGVTLSEYCTSKKRSTAELIELAIQIADGLQHAHDSGVVHRDLKPSNILVDERGRARILDFGIASLRGAARLTQTGSTVGTLAYAPPELAMGQPAEPVSDVYSLGVVLYQMLSGRLPFEADHEAALLYSILHEEPRPLADVKADLEPALRKVVETCLQKKPELRYQSCAELVAALKQARPREAGTPAPGAGNRPSIAVLPFNNMSADPENEYFSDGLTEELLNVLAKNPELKVTGRTSSFVFKGKREDLREIGQKLGVETLLEGSVRKSGNRVRITAQLVKAKDGFHLWSETYDRVIEDVFAVQDEIAGAVSKALNVTLLGRSSTKVIRDSKAYSLILQGQHLAYQNSEESLKEAVRSLEQALELDPDNPDALAVLAYSRIIQGGYGHADTGDMLAKAREAAQRAIAKDDSTFKAHIHLGWLHVMHCEWSQGEHEAQRAEELAPGAADVLFLRAALLAVQDQLPRAVDLLQRAKGLEPLSAVYFFHCGRMLWWSGQLALARVDLQKVLALSPGFTSARASLAILELMAGNLDTALVEAGLEKESGYKHWALAIVHHALRNQRESDLATASLEQVGRQWAVQLAQAEAYRGRIDSAFHWLDVAVEAHDAGLCWTRVHPTLANVHSDARWGRFLERIGLSARN